MNAQGGVLDIICAYALHSGRPFKEKNEFFIQLSQYIRPCTSHTAVITLGDFDAKLGSCFLGEDDIIGPYTYTCTANSADTANRALSMECCRTHKLALAGSFFEHAPEHQIKNHNLTAMPVWGQHS